MNRVTAMHRGKEYQSLRALAQALGVSPSAVSRALDRGNLDSLPLALDIEAQEADALRLISKAPHSVASLALRMGIDRRDALAKLNRLMRHGLAERIEIKGISHYMRTK